MFEQFSLLVLQQYWWAVVALLGALLVFLMFVQGGQTLIYTLGKNDAERKVIVNSLGRKWEITFTTLVTFGGAAFASFPLFYATSFSGAYWVWMLILFAFIAQAVSYEYRSKPGNFLGQRTYDVLLFANGLLATILIGTAVATFFTGSEFYIDEMNRSFWKNPWGGLELAFNLTRPQTYLNLSLGLAVFFLARTQAILYFMNDIDDDSIIARARKQLPKNALPFLVFFLTFVGGVLMSDGFAYDAETKVVSMVPHHYFNSLIAMPIVAAMFLLGVVCVLLGIYKAWFDFEQSHRKAIWWSGAGTVATVLALFLLAGYNQTAFYPSTHDLQSSLTIENASSSRYTLVAMGYASLMVPFVVAYIWYVWKALNNTPITVEEMEDDDHAY